MQDITNKSKNYYNWVIPCKSRKIISEHFTQSQRQQGLTLDQGLIFLVSILSLQAWCEPANGQQGKC